MIINLIPLGDIDPLLIKKLSKDLASKFKVDCRILKAVDLPSETYNPERNQYQAEKILERISEFELPVKSKTLGICDLDLYATDSNFIFGQAEIGDRDCLISLFRLNPKFYGEKFDEQIFYSRVLKEAMHELGHTFGLRHCPDSKCVMHFSNSLKDTDYKESEFCEGCKRRLNL